MREAMLIVHLLGLTMGVGTSFGFMFLGIAGSKMEKDEGQKFMMNAFALSRMGHIGLTLLIISGLYLMTPHWKTLSDRPLLIAKLILVVALTILISIATVAAGQAKKGQIEKLKKTALLGRFTLLISIAIVILAVLVFH